MKLFLVFLFTLVMGCHSAPPQSQIDQWKSDFNQGDVVGLDVRTSLELRLNPAPGAVHNSIVNLEPFIKNTPKDKKVFVFCESGGRSANAKGRLEKAGFTNVTDIGDWRTWNKINNKEKPGRL